MRRIAAGLLLGFCLACGFDQPTAPHVAPKRQPVADPVVEPEPGFDLDSDPTLFPEIATMSVEQLEQELELIQQDRAETTQMLNTLSTNIAKAMDDEDESAPLVKQIANLEETLDQSISEMDTVMERIRKRRARKRALVRRLEQLVCESGAPCRVEDRN